MKLNPISEKDLTILEDMASKNNAVDTGRIAGGSDYNFSAHFNTRYDAEAFKEAADEIAPSTPVLSWSRDAGKFAVYILAKCDAGDSPFDEVKVFRAYEVQWYSKRYSKWKYATTKPDADSGKSYASLLLEAYGEWAKAARVINIKTEEVIETWINPRPDEQLLDEPEHAEELVRHLRLAMSL